jgi:hypothetical protein
MHSSLPGDEGGCLGHTGVTGFNHEDLKKSISKQFDDTHVSHDVLQVVFVAAAATVNILIGLVSHHNHVLGRAPPYHLLTTDVSVPLITRPFASKNKSDDQPGPHIVHGFLPRGCWQGLFFDVTKKSGFQRCLFAPWRMLP